MMNKKELIEENKNLIRQNGELMYLLEFGKLRCEDSKHQMIWEHDSNARVFKQRIDRAIEYINNNQLFDFKYDEEEMFEYITDLKVKEDLRVILGGKE